MTEEIGIVEVARLKVIGTDSRTLVQVLGSIFVVLFPQFGPVAEIDPLLAHFCIPRKAKIGSGVSLVQKLPVPATHDQTVTSGHLPHLDPTAHDIPVLQLLRHSHRNYALELEKPAAVATPRNFR